MRKLQTPNRKAVAEIAKRSFSELRTRVTTFFQAKASGFVDASEAWCSGPQTSTGMLRGTAIALWGALIGAVIASLAAYWLIEISEASRAYFGQNLAQYPVLDEYKKSALTKNAEKTFYFLFYGFGVICAAAALHFRRALARTRAFTFLISASAAIPALHVLVAGTTQRSDISFFALLVVAAALFVPALVFRFGSGRQLADGVRQSSTIVFDPRLLRIDGYVVIVLALLIIPLKLQFIAYESAYNSHPVSFLIGPALSALADGLLPGRDFIAFYGQGPSYLFRPFLSTDLAAVYGRYVVFLSAIVFAIHVSCYFVLRDFYRDRALACVTAIALIFTYHFGAGSVLMGPSALPVRFALIFVLAAVTVQAMTSSRSIRWLLLSGAIVGVSVFWNSETGVLMFVAVPVAYVGNEIFNRKFPWRIFFFIASAIATFLAVSAAAFGVDALSQPFFASLVEPLRLHSAGNWVGIVMNWEPGSGYIYQISAPAVAIATGMAALARGKDAEPRLDRERAYLIFFSIVALIFTPKWINRSLDAVWQQNAFAFLIIAVWWARIALRGAYSYYPSKNGAATLIASGGIFALLMLWSIADRLQPNIKVGLKAYVEFPTAINLSRLFRSEDYGIDMLVDDSDFKLVNSLLKLREPMLLLSNRDWLVLMKLGRAPKSYFLPLDEIFSSDHLARSFDGAKYLFVDRDYKFPPYVWLKDDLQDRLQREFRLVGESTRFLVYGRIQ
ncbi:MAG: hypothetical protein Q8M19_08190 [Reyranella sp.]|nr:hypothetical protein [Reyranella sp.]